jgi:hypothetical protein
VRRLLESCLQTYYGVSTRSSRAETPLQVDPGPRWQQASGLRDADYSVSGNQRRCRRQNPARRSSCALCPLRSRRSDVRQSHSGECGRIGCECDLPITGAGAEKRNSSAVMRISTSPRADRTTMPNPEVNVGPVVQGPGPREFHPDLLTHPQILILGETARFGRRALASALAQRDSGSPFGRRRAGGWDIEQNS